MRKDDLTKIRHMLDSAKEAISFSASRTRADLNYDRMLTLSLMKSVEIIGEAAARTSTGFHDQYPNIPWKNVIGMRNRLIHAYFDINLDILWNTIRLDLPPLITELEKVIEQEMKN
jgi:uncharacterized protein with HEPN domain